MEAGLRAHQAGDLAGAIAAYQTGLALAPDDAAGLNLLGTALVQMGDAPAGLPFLERAARAQRNNASVLGNLAQAYFAVGRYDDARETFRKASRADPRQPHFQLGIANSLAIQGRLSEAEPLLQRIVQRFPAEPLAWFNYGNVLRDLERTEEAATHFARAVQLAPEFPEGRNNLAGALHKLQRFDEAEREFRACIALAPDYLLARCNLASVLIDLGRFKEAEAECREVLRADPDMRIAHTYLGATLGHQGKLTEALTHHAAAARGSDSARALEAYAGALADVGRYADSARWFCRAHLRDMDSLAARQVLGTVELTRGCLMQGWRHYAWRPARLLLTRQYSDIRLTTALPEGLAGQHVCLLREQGLGDELYFLRWTRVLKDRGAHVTYRASTKIHALCARASYIDEVLEQGAALPPADHYLLVGDLPHALGTLPASEAPLLPADAYAPCMNDYAERIAVFWPTLPDALPLTPLDEKVSEISRRLAKAGPPPYIGITWRAGTAPETQQHESWVLFKECPMDGLAAAVARYPGTVLALQRKPAAGEIERFAQALGRPVHDFTAYNEDLEAMLALLTLIDEYVGVSNTNMHLRAGIGRMSRVLLPCPAEWRWMYGRRRSPWFPNFPVYRQSLQGDWSAALESLGEDLEAAGRPA
ncbi:MAG: tetratricopeptide repeat protein [Rhodospirillaceae bacterium]